MKWLHIVSSAALAGAIVLPKEAVLANLAIEDHHEQESAAPGSLLDDLTVFDTFDDTIHSAVKGSEKYLNDAICWVVEAEEQAGQVIDETTANIQSWIEDALDLEEPVDTFIEDEADYHHPHKPNQTIYELISKSKYTTKLAKLIEDDKDLVKLLNGTAANYTFFAPTDRAFAKIPEHAPEPSKELVKKVLLYHISSSFYPAGRVLHSHTIPTLLNSSALGDFPQRLHVGLGLRGLALNFYSKVVAANIFAKNGVIHAVDSIIIPPPPTLAIIGFLPTEFSTLSLGLSNTELLKELNETAHAGSTFFAPTNVAFKKLGPKINGFLFSKYGAKYLKALLKYHVVYNQTLYSDAFYNDSGSSAGEENVEADSSEAAKGPRRHIHVDLPTLLDDKSLSVDISHFGPFITIEVNRFTRVTVQDGVARDGVIQVVGNVLIPPKKPSAPADDDERFWRGEELSVEDLKERLEPYTEGEWRDL